MKISRNSSESTFKSIFSLETRPSLSPSNFSKISPIFYLFVFSTIIFEDLFTFDFERISSNCFSSCSCYFCLFSKIHLWSRYKLSVSSPPWWRSLEIFVTLIKGLNNSYPVLGSIKFSSTSFYFYFLSSF